MSEAKSRVKCRVCSKENTDAIGVTLCTTKGTKVHANKSRLCDAFDYDPSKVRVKQKLNATYIKGGDFKAYRLKMIEEYMQQASGAQVLETAKDPDVLARFRSTADNEGEQS